MEQRFDQWLVVSDIDGTLNDKSRRLPQRNLEAILRFTGQGGHFSLASGRNVSSLGKHLEKLPIDGPAVVLNGAGVFDYAKSEMIWRRSIDAQGQSVVQDIMKRFPLAEVGIFFDDFVYIVRPGVLSCGQGIFDFLKFRVCKWAEVPTDGWGKVIFWSNPMTINAIVRYAQQFEKEPVCFMRSSPVTYEVLAKGANKGAAILELAKLLHIDQAHIAAIGDYYNDWDMLKAVGLPACAGQAPQDIHDICKFEACHCNDGCVGDLLEYIMDKNGGLPESYVKKA